MAISTIRKKLFLTIIAAFCLSANIASSATTQSLTDSATLNAVGAANSGDRTYTETLTIANTGALPLKNLILTFKNVSPGVSLAGAEYNDDGDPFVYVYPDTGMLQSSKNVIFQAIWQDASARPTYDPVLSSRKLQSKDLATLQLKGFYSSEGSDQPMGPPVGANAEIYVDGFKRGVTAVDGTAKILIASDEVGVQLSNSVGLGSAQIKFNAGTPTPLNIIINPDSAYSADLELRLQNVRHGVLPRSQESLKMSLYSIRNQKNVQNGTSIPIKQLESMELLDEDGESIGDLTETCEVVSAPLNGSRTPDTVVCNDTQAIQSILATAKGKVTFSVRVDGEKGAATTVYLGDAALVGTLAASPSKSDLKLAGVLLKVKVHGTSLVYRGITDDNGRFNFRDLPRGIITVNAETQQGGKYFYGDAQVDTEGLENFILTMKSADDFITTQDKSLQRSTVERSEPLVASRFALSDDSEEDNNYFMVWADAKGNESGSVAEAMIPKGVKSLALSFITDFTRSLNQASSGAWHFELFTGIEGKKIFSLARQVIEQSRIFPLITDNTISENPSFASGTKVIDVSELTQNGSAFIKAVVKVTGVNSGVRQTVIIDGIQGSASGLNIESAKPEVGWAKVSNAKVENYFSIPLDGDINSYQRNFDVKINKTSDVSIRRVRAEAIIDGATLLLSDTNVSKNYDVINENTLRIRSTLEKIKSTISVKEIPISNKLSFRFTVDGTGDNGKSLTSSYIAQGYHVLWPLQGEWDRYGGNPEPQGDRWSDARTLAWLAIYKEQMNALNDISGEHSWDLGHQSHARGTDIDMYHFLPLPYQKASGTLEYFSLLKCIGSLIYLDSKISTEKKIADECKSKVVNWITLSRNGIDRVAALPNVKNVLYINAGPLKDKSGATIPIKGNLWGANLLKTGKITVTDNSGEKPVDKEINLGTGDWTNVKYIPAGGHYHHVHVTLGFKE